MKITYMGTAAAERIPGIFCNCDNCRRALATGGKNIRTLSQVLIDDCLLVDLSSDTYMHFLKEGRTLWNVGHVLITHAHTDHLAMDELESRIVGFPFAIGAVDLRCYAGAYTTERIHQYYRMRDKKIPDGISFQRVEPFSSVDIIGYTVTPMPARHMQEGQALLYLIEKDGKCLFYGNDTGYFDTQIDEWLEKHGKHIDLLSLDCTKGDTERDYYTHMSMAEGRKIADRFLERGLIDESTKLYYTHFSHNCGMTHEELENAAAGYGFQVAYDGLKVEF